MEEVDDEWYGRLIGVLIFGFEGEVGYGVVERFRGLGDGLEGQEFGGAGSRGGGRGGTRPQKLTQTQAQG